MRAHRLLSPTTSVVALAFLALLGTGTHTVSRGETLAGIAARYGTSASSLAAANGISNPNRIVIGARLQVPAGPAAPAPAARAATTSYTVRAGDTLGSIAARAGSTISSVVALNSLSSANVIRVGQVLALPATAAATATPNAAPTRVQTPLGGATLHVVRAGDTIGGIATRYGISQAQLIDANGLTGGRIYIGQGLRLVPVTAAAAAPASTSGTTHTMAAGESLSDIARRFGTTIRAIQDANGITDPNLVVIGRVLKIPAAGPTSMAIVCPIQGPMHHTNDWGFPRSGGRFHVGNDLFAARGTPAVALVSGTVIQTVGVLGGNQVKLLGDDGTTYYYTHLERFGTGGRVGAGAVIGYVGTSGNAVGGPPHVHFEMHPGGGAAVNPFPRIDAACR